MAKTRDPLPVKLFIGMLSSDPALFNECTKIICEKYGPVDYQSEVLPWDKTDYYQDEMGEGIVRKFIFFERLMDPGDLPKVKLFTNEIEKDFALRTGTTTRRRINLDPGYVTEAKVVLATTKDFAHRVYIGSNIYAEVTLRYNTRDRHFTHCDYTYPDYRTDAYQTVFIKARDLLREALHNLQKGPA
jgi:hypothetical protein